LPDTSAAFKKEIPVYPNGKKSIFYEHAKDYGTQLNLENIDSGFNGLQIRVWYSFYGGEKLLVITNRETFWSAVVYILKESLVKGKDVVSPSEMKQLVPKSGWTYFAKRLEDLQIITLPHMSYGGTLPNDPDCYFIEVATKNLFRIYGYCDPDSCQDQFAGAKKMVKILKLFKDELDVPYKYTKDEFQ
jgi:hypothetical protein